LACVDDLNSSAATVKLHVSVDECIERIVATLSNPSSGVKSVADLANEDISGSHLLAAESLYAATLGI
jgi:hypothetical protein